jgi:hypothetical protein
VRARRCETSCSARRYRRAWCQGNRRFQQLQQLFERLRADGAQSKFRANCAMSQDARVVTSTS